MEAKCAVFLFLCCFGSQSASATRGMKMDLGFSLLDGQSSLEQESTSFLDLGYLSDDVTSEHSVTCTILPGFFGMMSLKSVTYFIWEEKWIMLPQFPNGLSSLNDSNTGIWAVVFSLIFSLLSVFCITPPKQWNIRDKTDCRVLRLYALIFLCPAIVMLYYGISRSVRNFKIQVAEREAEKLHKRGHEWALMQKEKAGQLSSASQSGASNSWDLNRKPAQMAKEGVKSEKQAEYQGSYFHNETIQDIQRVADLTLLYSNPTQVYSVKTLLKMYFFSSRYSAIGLATSIILAFVAKGAKCESRKDLETPEGSDVVYSLASDVKAWTPQEHTKMMDA